MSSRLSLKQNIAVLAAAIAVVIISVLVTLYFSGSIDLNRRDRNNSGYQNITFTDAVLTCEENARGQFGSRLQNLVVDNHSSRYDGKQFLYKIFIEADVKMKADQPPVLHYVNCFVKSSNGRLAKFESFEDQEMKNSPASDNTNMFGWPK